ncbi:hypothetical protein ACFORL_09335 [Legionella dresdenensis]|uniref:YcxB-like protein domain-containing protein n=1 Tax=Legionella dresdenensis TaxID=450200 RepID=A0ABV8CG03_9GAMM
MLNWSNCTVTFSDSGYYIRTCLFIYGLAIAALLNSSLPLSVKFGLGFVLMLYLLVLLKRKKTYPNLDKLEYKGNKWTMFETTGIAAVYTTHQILIDGGIFFLVKLTGENTARKLVIFKDQISADDRRILHILARLTTHQLKNE